MGCGLGTISSVPGISLKEAKGLGNIDAKQIAKAKKIKENVSDFRESPSGKKEPVGVKITSKVGLGSIK